jgi:hypothetical protein
MIRLLPSLLLLLALSGCAALEEAYYVDREFGTAAQSTWDRQVAHPDLRHAGNLPRSLDPRTAEETLRYLRPTDLSRTNPDPGLLILQ